MPLVKKAWVFPRVKAAHTEVELEEAKKAIAILGGKVEGTSLSTCHMKAGNRHVVTILETKGNS